jgi:hypothetical protein
MAQRISCVCKSLELMDRVNSVHQRIIFLKKDDNDYFLFVNRKINFYNNLLQYKIRWKIQKFS